MVRSPFDGALVGTVPRSLPDDVVLAVARLRVAQEEWTMRSFDDRARIFLRFHDALLDRQEEILDLIERVRDEFAVPILYVSHARSEVERLADKVVCLENGRVTATGTPADVFGLRA